MADGHPNTLPLVIASVGETKFDGAAIAVTVPGSSGIMQILPHHEAFVTTLKPGLISVKASGGETKTFEIESGVVECSNNKVVVLL